MDTESAMQHALGYASGREDSSNPPVKTADPRGQDMGWVRFAEAYAEGWADYNAGRRYFMTNARSAYDAWQVMRGESIFVPRDRTDAMEARRVAREAEMSATVAGYAARCQK